MRQKTGLPPRTVTHVGEQKMDEPVITVIATIFIPLTFIASVYGMNFNPAASPFNMPKLNWYRGYPATLLLMLAVARTMVIYFRRRGWL